MLDQLIAGQKDNILKAITEKIGIGGADAEGFFGKAVEMIQGMIGSGKLDMASLMSGDVSKLMGGMDMSKLSPFVGGSEEKAKQGVEAMMSPLVEGLKGADGGMLEKLTKGDAGGLLKGIGGKLFGG